MVSLPKNKLAGTLALAFLLGSLSLGDKEAFALEERGDDSLYGTYPAANQPGRSEEESSHKEHGVPGLPILDEVAAILGIQNAALKETLGKGKSLAEAAAEIGISEADLSAKLTALRSAKIDQAVKEGRLDAERAAQMKQRMADHLKRMLQDKALLEHHEKFHGKDKVRYGLKPNQEKLAQAIGISRQDLQLQLSQGKSLQQIAESKGITKRQLIERIQNVLAPDLEKYIEQKVPAAKDS
ncbi:hypothetical protein [Paenibacillus lutrae]|uniref:Uncharacterized protein n=1 Tax=Paenibacillus lutrae TaxID=2078573 RepID=A0A7X3FGZ0_9BACL|nr:hypothetical protein [Paenibacillus lutrae]MVO99298.1 hypothetical protein [Paenibacillus lutrae]